MPPARTPQPSGWPCWEGWSSGRLVVFRPLPPSSSLVDSLCPGPRSHLRKTGCPPKPASAPRAAVAEPLVGPQDPEAAQWPHPWALTSDGHVSEFQHPRAWRQLSFCYSSSLNCLFFSLSLCGFRKILRADCFTGRPWSSVLVDLGLDSPRGRVGVSAPLRLCPLRSRRRAGPGALPGSRLVFESPKRTASHVSTLGTPRPALTEKPTVGRLAAESLRPQGVTPGSDPTQRCRLLSATFPKWKQQVLRGAGPAGEAVPGRGFQRPQGRGTARRPGRAVRGVSAETRTWRPNGICLDLHPWGLPGSAR